MSEPMKKHPTKTKTQDVYSKLIFDFGDETHTYRFVPSEKLGPIKKLLDGLVQYEDKNALTLDKKNHKDSWRDLFKDVVSEVGGEVAYRESALAVRSCRKEMALSQKELASKLGIDQAYLSKIECAKIPVGKGIAKRLSKVFGIGYKVFLSDLI